MNRLLQRLGDAGWNQIPLPRSWNSAIYRHNLEIPVALGVAYGGYRVVDESIDFGADLGEWLFDEQ